MTTTVTSVISTTGNGHSRGLTVYSTLQTWEDACPADISAATGTDQIWRGECYNDGEFLAGVLISGETTDASGYLELTAAAGQSFVDDVGVRSSNLMYDVTKGVGINPSSGNCFVSSGVAYTRISRIQSLTAGLFAHQRNMSFGTNNRADQLIVQALGPSGSSVSFGIGTGMIARNCVVISNSEGATRDSGNPSNAELHHCTFLGMTSFAPASPGSAMTNMNHGSGNKAYNCAFFGFGTLTAGAAYWSTCEYCVTDKADPLLAWSTTGSLFSKATTSNIEGFTLASNYDARAKAGGDLLANGSNAPTNSPTVDITGYTRANPPTIGAWEATASGAQSYSYTAAGGIVFAGAAPKISKRVNTAAGGITFAGTAPYSSSGTQTRTVTPSGGITFAGAVAQILKRINTAAGGITFAGAAAQVLKRVNTAAGGITFAGTAAQVRKHAIAAAGGITFGGVATVTTHVAKLIVAAAGGITFGGAAAVSYVGRIARDFIIRMRRRRL